MSDCQHHTDFEFADLTHRWSAGGVQEFSALRLAATMAHATGERCPSCGDEWTKRRDRIPYRQPDGSIRVVCRNCSAIEEARRDIQRAQSRR